MFGHRRRDFVSEYRIPLEQARGRSELFRIFKAHKGRAVHKWVHFLDLYDRHFGGFRDPKFLEIGVESGGSLQMWRKFFGEHATIFGVDIDARCSAFVDGPTKVRIGSQDDGKFLEGVVAEMGGLDIVLDDGSHIGRHQRTSFRTLFPLLADGGIYAIEDLHTSYWKGWEGGYRRRGTGIEMLKDLVDDMHQWWHNEKVGEPNIGAIHFYDSIAFIEKAARTQPQVAWASNPDFEDWQ